MWHVHMKYTRHVYVCVRVSKQFISWLMVIFTLFQVFKFYKKKNMKKKMKGSDLLLKINAFENLYFISLNLFCFVRSFGRLGNERTLLRFMDFKIFCLSLLPHSNTFLVFCFVNLLRFFFLPFLWGSLWYKKTTTDCCCISY